MQILSNLSTSEDYWKTSLNEIHKLILSVCVSALIFLCVWNIEILKLSWLKGNHKVH